MREPDHGGAASGTAPGVSDREIEAALARCSGDARETVKLLLQERAILVALVSRGYVRARFDPLPPDLGIGNPDLTSRS